MCVVPRRPESTKRTSKDMLRANKVGRIRLTPSHKNPCNRITANPRLLDNSCVRCISERSWQDSGLLL